MGASKHSGKGKKKQPVISEDISTSRVAKWLGPTNIENRHLSWRFGKADVSGPYPCNSLAHAEFQQLWERLRAFESMNHATLKKAGSLHEYPVAVLSKDAKERLKDLQLDDIDLMYSFHIDGACRMWCVKYESIFMVLWWDKDHGVYPMGKKHT